MYYFWLEFMFGGLLVVKAPTTGVISVQRPKTIGSTLTLTKVV